VVLYLSIRIYFWCEIFYTYRLMTAMQSYNSQQWLAQMEELFKACADQTRLRILNMLAREGEICVCHLVDVLQTNQPKVSRHLAYLKRVGLVADRKDRLWVHYRLATPLTEHAQRLLDCLNSCCAEVPEMQRDVVCLQAVRCAQPLVKLGRRPLTESAVMIAEEKTSVARESEIEIELL
jgi:ArsR family transcriptional regulator, arsenate/arsenite/antimonite-responsive transcriptional repressor